MDVLVSYSSFQLMDVLVFNLVFNLLIAIYAISNALPEELLAPQ